MQYISILKTLIALLPLLIDVVRAVEAAIPASGQGSVKLALVKDILSAGYKAASDITVQFEALWPMLSAVIDAVVAGFNKAGSFSKG